VTSQSAQEMELAPGDAVWAVVKATAIHLNSADVGPKPDSKPRKN
jgi:molybdopterin-binding protein